MKNKIELSIITLTYIILTWSVYLSSDVLNVFFVYISYGVLTTIAAAAALLSFVDSRSND